MCIDQKARLPGLRIDRKSRLARLHVGKRSSLCLDWLASLHIGRWAIRLVRLLRERHYGLGRRRGGLRATPQPGAREGEADNGTWCSRAQLATQLPTLRFPFNTVKRRGLDQRSSFVKTTALAILCHLHRLTFSLGLHWVQRRRDISNRISVGNCSTALSVAGWCGRNGGARLYCSCYAAQFTKSFHS